jgi:hypothetical protein
MSPTNEPQVVYVSRPYASGEDELNALATIYRFVLDCRAKKEGDSTIAAPNDVERSPNASDVGPILHE